MTRGLLIVVGWVLNLSVHAQISKPDSLLSFQSPFDTLQLSLPKAKVDSLLKIKKNRGDSLRTLTSKPINQLNRAEGKLDSLQHSLQSKLDSLTKLPSPDSLAIKMMARIASKSDSVKLKIDALRSKTKPPGEMGKISSKIEGPATQVQLKVNEKLSAFQQNGAADLPTVPGLPSMPSVSLPEGSQLGNANLPAGSLPRIKSGGIDISEVDLPSASLPSVDKPAIPSVNKPDVGLGNYSEKVAGVTDQVKGYQNELKDFDPGKLDEIKNADHWEDKLAELDEVGELKKQIDLADQAKRYFDPEVAKEEALNKAKQEAINHFAGHEEELKVAMEQLSKLKAKIPDAEGVIDLFAKRKNPLKSKSFVERLVPGLALQFQNQGSFWLDLNPYIGYKISSRFTSGLGWNERIAYNFDDMQWDSKNHVYGLRGFVHFKLKTNFWLKAEAEIMNSPLRASPLISSDIVGRDWIASYFAGIKKDFQLTKHLKGNVQMLYNLYNPEKKSPYVNRFNVRMGFELPLKKKTKESA